MDIKVRMEGMEISQERIKVLKNEAGVALDRLWSGKEPMTGWVQDPLKQNEGNLEYMLDVADIVKQEAQLMVVIGVGGSYMGANAAIKALPKDEDGIEVRFAGINFCSAYHRELVEEAKRRETVICVISKSGNTLEVKAMFDIFKGVLREKYSSDTDIANHIIVITDEQTGSLRREAEEREYISFPVPRDIGGRYSVLTPVGLFPMAVAGIDIRQVLEGADLMAASPAWDHDGTDYAITRFLMMADGKSVEVLEFFDTRLACLGEWLKQLYGESEGKDGKGLFPVTLNFSTDLHSMGQFLQQGNPIFFETAVIVDDCGYDMIIPEGELKGRTLEELNKAVVKGAVEAHRKAGTTVVEIHIPQLTSYYYGQLIYFFETTCAVTAMIMGVNPFDQPGVEEYKEEMRKYLVYKEKV
ncbi:MAG: glucose-6-phosphate isomerase [Clostridiales bacterium]|nr:glucose-6-phosphate isomerase [Clostridiales bacterium]